MIRDPRCSLIVLVVMVLCLGSWAFNPTDSQTETGVRYSKKHLKHARGRMLPAASAPSGRDDDTVYVEIRPEHGTEIILREEPIQPSFKSVRVADFKIKADQAESYHDVLRLFLGEGLSDETIDDYMTSLSRQSGHLSRETAIFGDITVEGMPAISHSRSTALTVRYDEIGMLHVMQDNEIKHDAIGIARDDVIVDAGYDTVQADAPKCEACHVIASSSKFKKSSKESRNLSHALETVRRRRRRHRPHKRHKTNRNDRKRNKKCKLRRKQLTDKINKCKRKGIRRKYCKKLRDRYQKLRRKCKTSIVNQSQIPRTETVVLPPANPTRLVSPARDNTSIAAEESGLRQEDWKKWEFTKQDTNLNGQCGRPVAEMVRIRDITHRGDVEYVPSCVLVYRCRPDSGCCDSHQECATKHSDTVSKSILLGERVAGADTVDAIKVEHFHIRNDTECACKDLPEIKPPCPYPFNHSRYECKCVKQSMQDYCSKISKGREALSALDIRCVVNGQCRPLDEHVCEYGQFRTEVGRCPKRNERQPKGG